MSSSGPSSSTIRPYTGPVGPGFLLLHNNAQLHVTWVPESFRRMEELMSLTSPHSPDLNLIEHLLIYIPNLWFKCSDWLYNVKMFHFKSKQCNVKLKTSMAQASRRKEFHLDRNWKNKMLNFQSLQAKVKSLKQKSQQTKPLTVLHSIKHISVWTCLVNCLTIITNLLLHAMFRLDLWHTGMH